jgi:hypothetical protein
MPYKTTLTRKAILISSSNTCYGHLPGADQDVARFSDFLLSDFGGAWEAEEIGILFTPSRGELEPRLEEASAADYVFISFAGHGQHVVGGSLNDTRIILNDSEEMFVHELNPRNRRHLVVVDACRTLVEIEPVAKLGSLAEAVCYPTTNRLACRERFDAAVAQAEEGRVVAYSCGVNQSAGESVGGGFFSRFLVEGAEQACIRSRERGVLFVREAFSIAQTETLRKNSPQRPVLEAGRRIRHFPFAVVA